MSKVPYVNVVWHDAWKSATIDINKDLSNVKEYHKPAKQETRGWLLAQDEEGVLVAAERNLDSDDGGYRAPHFIPANMIVSVDPFPATRKARVKKPKVSKNETSPPITSSQLPFTTDTPSSGQGL